MVHAPILSKKMSILKTYKSPAFLVRRIRTLRKQRKANKVSTPRKRLTPTQKLEILKKTAGHCHICGGIISKTDECQFDHVFAHSMGGSHTVENYLPAHAVCNNARWHYQAEEIQWIIKMGSWLRYQVEQDTEIGRMAAEGIWKELNTNAKRRTK